MKTKHFFLTLCLSLLLNLVPGPVAQADSPGDLDPTFGSQGKVTTDFGFDNSEAKAAAVQPDGKIVVAGFSYNGHAYDFALARYKSDGLLDPTFSQDGLVTTHLSNDDNFTAAALALQPDGKLVVAGSSNGAFVVVRYQSNGQLDPTFSGDGIVTTDLEGDAQAVALQANGKIVVAGGSSGAFLLMRYNSNGVLDPNFDGDGIVITQVGIFGGAKAVAIQADGKILAAGTSHAQSGGDRFSLVRYKLNGSLDPDFGSGGISIIDFSGWIEEANAMALQPDGKIVVAGSNLSSSSQRNFALARYLSNGSLDPSFDSDGKVTTDFGGGYDQANALVIQPDGKIVAAGSNDDRFALVRYKQNGGLDATFSGDGKVSTNFTTGWDSANGVVLQSNGKIVAVGANSITFALARYTRSGTLDSTFDGDGKLTTPIGNRRDSGRAMVLQPDGKIVVAGYSNTSCLESCAGDDFAVIRYNSNGSLNLSFSGDGKVTTHIGGDRDRANAIALQADGKIVVAGNDGSSVSDTPAGQFTLIRYRSNGSLDPTFDTDGKVVTQMGQWSFANAIAIQPDNKIVVAGEAAIAGEGYNSGFALARYRSNGSLDPGFGNGGKVTTDFNNDYLDSAYAMAIQADGKIVLVGYTYTDDQDYNFALARYKGNGGLDPDFGSGGKVTTDFDGHSDSAHAVALQVNGRIVVAGASNGDFILVRYRSNGNLDTGFGSGGKVITDFDGGDNSAQGIAIQADGKIVVAGMSNNRFALARYTISGSLDPTFGSGGKVVTSFSGNTGAYAVVLQPDGRIIVAGEGNNDFALARYQSGGMSILSPTTSSYYLPLIFK